MEPPKILPPHYFLAAVAAMALVAWLVGRGLIGGWLPYIGLLPMLAGLVITIYAARQFARADTNLVPLTKSTTLVTDGLYVFTRNPMYLGMVLFLIGTALLSDNALNWIIVVVFIVIIRTQFIAKEEKLMAETFGESYEEYKSRVRRWI